MRLKSHIEMVYFNAVRCLCHQHVGGLLAYFHRSRTLGTERPLRTQPVAPCVTWLLFALEDTEASEYAGLENEGEDGWGGTMADLLEKIQVFRLTLSRWYGEVVLVFKLDWAPWNHRCWRKAEILGWSEATVAKLPPRQCAEVKLLSFC